MVSSSPQSVKVVGLPLRLTCHILWQMTLLQTMCSRSLACLTESVLSERQAALQLDPNNDMILLNMADLTAKIAEDYRFALFLLSDCSRDLFADLVSGSCLFV